MGELWLLHLRAQREDQRILGNLPSQLVQEELQREQQWRQEELMRRLRGGRLRGAWSFPRGRCSDALRFPP